METNEWNFLYIYRSIPTKSLFSPACTEKLASTSCRKNAGNLNLREGLSAEEEGRTAFSRVHLPRQGHHDNVLCFSERTQCTNPNADKFQTIARRGTQMRRHQLIDVAWKNLINLHIHDKELLHIHAFLKFPGEMSVRIPRNVFLQRCKGRRAIARKRCEQELEFVLCAMWYSTTSLKRPKILIFGKYVQDRTYKLFRHTQNLQDYWLSIQGDFVDGEDLDVGGTISQILSIFCCSL